MSDNSAKILMLLGIVIMLIGVGTTVPPLAVVAIGEVEIRDIPALSASLIGVGAIIFLAGVAVYFRR